MKKYLRFSKYIIMGTLAVSCGRNSSDSQVNQTGNQGIIGGQLAGADQFPSTLQYNETCTGTVIGDYHILTAAHCVVSSGYKPSENSVVSYNFGHSLDWHQEVLYSEAKRLGKVNNGNIVKTFVHPSYMALTRRHPNAEGVSIDINKTTDLAVIVVEDKIPSHIPRAKIDFDYKPTVGDTIVLNGYGCEHAPDASTQVKEWLKRQKYVLSGITGSPSEVQFSTEHSLKFLDGKFVLDISKLSSSERRRVETIDGSLCQGDSGGAVFRDADGVSDGKGDLRIIGVNSNLFGENSNVARIDKHTPIINAVFEGEKQNLPQAASWIQEALEFDPTAGQRPKDFKTQTLTCSKGVPPFFEEDVNPSYKLIVSKLSFKERDGQVISAENIDKIEVLKTFKAGNGKVYQSTIQIPVTRTYKGPFSWVGQLERKANGEVMTVTADINGNELSVFVDTYKYPRQEFDYPIASNFFRIKDIVNDHANCSVK